MISHLLLWYLRYFPVEKKKYILEKYLNFFLPAKGIKPIYTNPHGIRFWMDTRDFVMHKIYTRGVYERNTIRHVRNLIKNEKTHFIDCGANIGMSVVYCKRQFPKARILAFEPERKHNPQFHK